MTQGKWNTITRESVDLRDGIAREIFIEKHELVETKRVNSKTKKKETATKYSGLCNGHGPISFLATDHLAESMEHDKAVGKLFQLQWRGKKQMANGQTFNVFQVMNWEGELPPWVNTYSMTAKTTQHTAMSGDDDYPTEPVM